VNPEYQYRLTKYDPSLRDETGAFQGDDWTTVSDIGETFGGVQFDLSTYLEVESRHLIAVASFIEEAAVTKLVARNVENHGKLFRVAEDDHLSPIQAVEAVRQMLREEGVVSTRRR
jgi:hypothetical protein